MVPRATGVLPADALDTLRQLEREGWVAANPSLQTLGQHFDLETREPIE
jgi:hypothetical protein